MKDRLTQANNSSEKTSEELILRTQVDNKEEPEEESFRICKGHEEPERK